MPDVKSAESYAEKYFQKPDSILYMPSKQEKSLKSIFDVAYKLSLKTGAQLIELKSIKWTQKMRVLSYERFFKI